MYFTVFHFNRSKRWRIRFLPLKNDDEPWGKFMRCNKDLFYFNSMLDLNKE